MYISVCVCVCVILGELGFLSSVISAELAEAGRKLHSPTPARKDLFQSRAALRKVELNSLQTHNHNTPYTSLSPELSVYRNAFLIMMVRSEKIQMIADVTLPCKMVYALRFLKKSHLVMLLHRTSWFILLVFESCNDLQFRWVNLLKGQVVVVHSSNLAF